MPISQAHRHCLITGGAGFIGSHLADALLAKGYQVTAIDNLSAGKTDNLARAMQHPNFRFEALDVRNRDLLEPLVAQATDVYHLASYVGVRLANQASTQHILNNINAISTLLDLVETYRPRFLLTSSSEIYGNVLSHINGTEGLREDSVRLYGPIEVPRWAYAGIKAIEEFLTLGKHAESGLETVIVRLFNVVGPRQNADLGMVFPRFIQQAIQQKPITIYGNGQQLRCFTDIRDAIYAMQVLMDTPTANGQIFNIGQPQPNTILELAQQIFAHLDLPERLEYRSYESVFGSSFEDINKRIPDIQKLQAFTGFTPQYSLADTIAYSTKWIQEQVSVFS